MTLAARDTEDSGACRGGKGGDVSVVNKMLRDLDARRIGADERAALPTAVTPLAAHDERGRGRAGPLLAAILLLSALAVAAWLALRPEVPPPSPCPGCSHRGESARDSRPLPRRSRLRQPAACAWPSSYRPARRRWLHTVPPEPAPKPAAATALAPLPAAMVAPSSSPAKVTPAEPRIEKQARPLSAAERAEAEYRRGLALLRAEAGRCRRRVSVRAGGATRARGRAAALAALLIEARAYDEAEEVLRKGTELPAVRLASAIALARLKVERNQSGAALEVLQQHAAAGERSADYLGFAGALLNRAGRPAEPSSAIRRRRASRPLTDAGGPAWALHWRPRGVQPKRAKPSSRRAACPA